MRGREQIARQLTLWDDHPLDVRKLHRSRPSYEAAQAGPIGRSFAARSSIPPYCMRRMEPCEIAESGQTCDAEPYGNLGRGEAYTARSRSDAPTIGLCAAGHLGVDESAGTLIRGRGRGGVRRCILLYCRAMCAAPRPVLRTAGWDVEAYGLRPPRGAHAGTKLTRAGETQHGAHARRCRDVWCTHAAAIRPHGRRAGGAAGGRCDSIRRRR